jgi:tyrosyl-tRNA synthetase
LNASDADARKWISIFTFLSKEEISGLIMEHDKDASKRVLQKKLAQEITVFVHGEEAYQKAIDTTDKLFAQQQAPAESLSVVDLQRLEGILHMDVSKSLIENGIDVVSLLTETRIFPSKGEARKMIQNGGVSINRHKVDNPQLTVNAALLLHGQYLLVQKGKKHYYLVKTT